MVCFGTPVWADRIRRGGDAGMAGGSRFVAIGEQGLNSFAVAVNLGDEGTLVGGLLAGLDGAAGGAGGSGKLGTKAGAAALNGKALTLARRPGGAEFPSSRGAFASRAAASRAAFASREAFHPATKVFHPLRCLAMRRSLAGRPPPEVRGRMLLCIFSTVRM